MKTILNSIFILLLSLLMTSNTSYSQERIIKGIVTTFDSIPLVNAQITILSSKDIVLTDTLGRFTINCKLVDKIKVNARGFLPRKVRINEKSSMVLINLHLLSNQNSKEVAVGYGHIRNIKTFNTVSSLHEKDNNRFSEYANMFELIKGQFPGVHVYGEKIRIRGKHSIKCSNDPLVVIDGIISRYSILESLPTSNVKSINILKGSSATIYGARASGGVIVIETKGASN